MPADTAVGNVVTNTLNITVKNTGVASCLFESEEAYKSGKNPTVRFDNDGLQENNKLLLKSR